MECFGSILKRQDFILIALITIIFSYISICLIELVVTQLIRCNIDGVFDL